MGTMQPASRELEAAGSCKNSLGVRPKARGWSWHVCLFLHRSHGIANRAPGRIYSRGEKVELPHSPFIDYTGV